MGGPSPRIGIVADHRTATLGPWGELSCTLLPHSYVEAIDRAGGAPFVIPLAEGHAGAAAELMALFDGLLLIGGRDIDPGRYAAAPHPASEVPHELRDRLELELTRAALDQELPVLGVCRGMQVLNILYGGDLEQHLGDRIDLAPHREVVGTFSHHTVAVEQGSRLAEVVRSRKLHVASHHHQGAGRIGLGLDVAAVAPDGTVEALEDPGRQFCLGVLWHPEETLSSGGLLLFEALVAHAAEVTRESRIRAIPSRSPSGVIAPPRPA